MTTEHRTEPNGSYNPAYYETRADAARESAEVIVPLVCQLIRPRSIVDVGCATGSWLSVAKSHGVTTVLGLDLEILPRDLLEIDRNEFMACDLSKPIDPGRTFDLVVSLEVAEHLPSSSAPVLLDLLTSLGPVVLFSAAIPFQGGRGHVNEQWPSYWADGFGARGYAAIDCMRMQLWSDRRVRAHYAQNMLLYVKRDCLHDYPALLPWIQQESFSQGPPHLVHPRVYLKLMRRLAGLSGAMGGYEEQRSMAFARPPNRVSTSAPRAVEPRPADTRADPARADARKLRICFATTEYPPHTGGAGRSARRLVQGLAAQGFDVTVFTGITEGSPRGGFTSSDGLVTVRWVPRDYSMAVRIIEEADRAQPFDVFHGFTPRAAYPMLDIAANGDRPVVCSLRGIDGLEFDMISTEVLQQCQWVTSVSSDSLVRATAIADLSRRSSVIPNGIDLETFQPWSPLAANHGVVGTVATFRIKKNIPLLIRAYAGLPSDVRQRLLLVGGISATSDLAPKGRRAIEDVIDETGLRDEVELTGLVEHDRISEYHQRMRVFAVSSDHEGMPNSILEAAASGLPIVSTAVDGIKDIFTDDVDALLVPPGDAAALTAALQRVLTDDALALRLSAAARALASRLTCAEEVRRYVELYASLT